MRAVCHWNKNSAAELAQRRSVSLVDLLTGRMTYTRNANGSGAAYDAFALQPRSFVAAGDASGALATDGAACWLTVRFSQKLCARCS